MIFSLNVILSEFCKKCYINLVNSFKVFLVLWRDLPVWSDQFMLRSNLHI